MFTLNIEQLYRAGFVQSASIPQTYSKSVIHPIASIPQLNGSSAFYNQVVQNQMQYNTLPTRNASIQRYNKQQQHQNSQQVTFFFLANTALFGEHSAIYIKIFVIYSKWLADIS